MLRKLANLKVGVHIENCNPLRKQGGGGGGGLGFEQSLYKYSPAKEAFTECTYKASFFVET